METYQLTNHDAAAVLLRRPVEAPLVGLPIGKMLSELSRATFIHPQST